MAFSRLPTELLDMVLRHLSKPELKVARQTCKSLNKSVVPLLFDTVYVAANRLDMEKAALLCSSFGPFVHHMVYGSLSWYGLPFNLFLEENYEYFKGDGSKTPSENNNNIELIYKSLPQPRQLDLHMLWTQVCYLADESEGFMKSGDLQSQLCQLLRVLRKLDTVTIDDHDHIDDDCCCYQILVDACNRQRKQIPSATDFFSAVQCKEDHLRRSRGCGLTGEYYNPMTYLLEALATTQVSVSNISIDIEYPQIRCANGLCLDAIRLPGESVQQLSRPLSGLTELKLLFEVPYYWVHPITILPCQKTILSAAVNLRKLHLEILDVDDAQIWLHENAILPNIFDAFLGSCAFPRLERFFLQNIDGTESALLQFLQGSPKLKDLTIRWFYMTSGNWAQLLKELRNSLMLETVEIGNFEGEPGEIYSEYLEPWSNSFYRDWASVVTRFFLNDGPNPFDKSTWVENRGDDKGYYRYCPVKSQ
ncbi:hypothetical protein G7Y79_00018g044990 [Physcia stellaris]|nr:hypothetical protein G7Y79_00018g044990 [Physcia stellaris]